MEKKRNRIDSDNNKRGSIIIKNLIFNRSFFTFGESTCSPTCLSSYSSYSTYIEGKFVCRLSDATTTTTTTLVVGDARERARDSPVITLRF